MEYVPHISGDGELHIHALDIFVSTVIFIMCVYLSIVMWVWCWQIFRSQRAALWTITLGTALAAMGTAHLHATELWNIYFYNDDLPEWTLPGRIILMIGVIVLSWATTRVTPLINVRTRKSDETNESSEEAKQRL